MRTWEQLLLAWLLAWAALLPCPTGSTLAVAQPQPPEWQVLWYLARQLDLWVVHMAGRGVQQLLRHLVMMPHIMLQQWQQLVHSPAILDRQMLLGFGAWLQERQLGVQRLGRVGVDLCSWMRQRTQELDKLTYGVMIYLWL